MGNKLFPEEIIDNSSEANFSKHSVQTKLIYLTVLGALVAIFIALPLIHVTVSVKSQGIIKPLTDRNKLVSLVSGRIDELYIEENASVVRGQTVAKISAPVLNEKIQFNNQRQQKIQQYLADLSVLLNLDASQMLRSLSSSGEVGTSPLLQFKEQILNAMRGIEQAKRQTTELTLTSLSGEDDNIILQNARNRLWQLLQVETTSLLPSNPEKQAAYQQVLSQFNQSIRSPLKNIQDARTKLDRHKLLNKRGIITDSTYMQSRSDVQTAWHNLLAVLSKESLSLLTVPSAKTDKTSEKTDIHLQTAKYTSSLLEFKQQVRNNIQKIKVARQKFNRNKELYEREVISEATYEKNRFSLESARNDFQLLFDQQRNKWQADRVSYQDELKQLRTDLQQTREKKSNYIIKAPISGTIQNMKGVYEGSPISPNQPIAEISPDTSLIAECYVPPKNIGLLREGMKARFQISAFDYNQWGLLTGQIKEISNDVTVVNERPVFKVRATLDKTWLELQNGYRGNLKKGMSLQARFKVTKRSLFQLLYDNLDDWLNPKWDEQTQRASM